MNELSYIGGLFDGEGCLSKGRITVGNKRLEMLTPLLLHFGGSLYTEKRPTGHYYVWNCGLPGRVVFLTTVLPYLIGQKADAEKLLVLLTTEAQVYKPKPREPFEVAKSTRRALVEKLVQLGLSRRTAYRRIDEDLRTHRLVLKNGILNGVIGVRRDYNAS